ncbi:MAG: N-acyl homoserine lactone acylase QqaR [Halioglobus sp.]
MSRPRSVRRPYPALTTLFSALILTGLAACNDSSDDASSGNPGGDVSAFNATVHRTDGGIPHIVAEDWASLGYGTAYAVAEDHYCEQAKNILKFRAQLSETFGTVGDNLNSDLFFRLMIDTGLYDVEIDPEFDALFEGYAAGFNRYTRDRGASVTDPACAGADWIPQVTAEDIRRIHLTPAFLPNVGFLMALASPPEPVARRGDAQPASTNSTPQRSTIKRNGPGISASEDAQIASLMAAINRDKGSNGIAIGSELSEDEHGLLYTNPHLDLGSFDFRMYGLHQIIPGVTNMLGANQAQRANVGFGTNGDVAWTNTVSAGVFFSFYELELVPGNPMAYLYDGEQREIESFDISIRVKDQNGDISERPHTFYRSHFGWLVGGALPWTTEKASSVRVADEGARGFQGGALAMSRARTVRELKGIIDQYANFPSTNVIAADSSGEVLYGDLSPTANLTDEQLAQCASPSLQVYVGNTSACEWNTDEDSAAPGLLGASKQPFLYRRDYVTNSNDSYWLANPEQPITGIPRVKGEAGTERTLRTRSGIALVRARAAGTDGLPGNTFDLDSLQSRMLSNSSMAAHVLLDGLVEACYENPNVPWFSGLTYDVSEGCLVLDNWDGTYNLDSRGAHLFREFLRLTRTNEDGRGAVPGRINMTTPFDPDNAATTPFGLDSSTNSFALSALAQAMRFWADAGIALDATLGELQSVTRNGERIPMHGADEFEGVINKMGLDLVGNEYPEITGSSASWVMITHVAGEQTRARGLTAYSQSSDPTSENYSNLTRRFSAKELPDIPFLLEDVEAQAISTTSLQEGSADCTGDGWQRYSGQGVSDENSCRAYFRSVYDRRLTDFVDD